METSLQESSQCLHLQWAALQACRAAPSMVSLDHQPEIPFPSLTWGLRFPDPLTSYFVAHFFLSREHILQEVPEKEKVVGNLRGASHI